jgi:DNA polymerase-4
MTDRVIFHIDVNSAFLSWTAAYQVNVLGQALDLRTVPSVIAGDKASRHSIILAKSIPAKKFGIHTGEPLFQAQEKCPGLLVAPPDYGLYVEASRHFIAQLKSFSPMVEQYSIDEAWMDMTGTSGLYGTPVAAAERVKQKIQQTLGFTVNIGISCNKLLAKMASDFEKPNRVHTLFPEEMPEKLWPLGVRELFMVGPATEQKLRGLGIYTIGDLACADPALIRRKLHKPGILLWHSANGRCTDAVHPEAEDNKGYGNSVTVPHDVTDSGTAHQVLLSLCETVGMRMRRDGKAGRCVTVSLRTNRFENWSHQGQLGCETDVTEEIFRMACRIFDETWDQQTPLRQLGVQVGRLSAGQNCRQCDFLSAVSAVQYERKAKLDTAVDSIRDKYGEDAILRARFLRGEVGSMAGGLSKERRSGVTKQV